MVNIDEAQNIQQSAAQQSSKINISQLLQRSQQGISAMPYAKAQEELAKKQSQQGELANEAKRIMQEKFAGEEIETSFLFPDYPASSRMTEPRRIPAKVQVPISYEKYKAEYEKLSPQLQVYFKSPAEAKSLLEQGRSEALNLAFAQARGQKEQREQKYATVYQDPYASSKSPSERATPYYSPLTSYYNIPFGGKIYPTSKADFVPESTLQPVYSKEEVHEPIFNMPIIGEETKKYYNPISTKRDVISGFVDTQTGKSIPIEKLNKEQIKQLESEGWNFKGDIPKFLNYPRPKTQEEYAKLIVKPIPSITTVAISPILSSASVIDTSLIPKSIEQKKQLVFEPLTTNLLISKDIIGYKPFPTYKVPEAKDIPAQRAGEIKRTMFDYNLSKDDYSRAVSELSSKFLKQKGITVSVNKEIGGGYSGKAQPQYNTIELTEKAGAGIFAHETGHMLDYYANFKTPQEFYSQTQETPSSIRLELAKVRRYGEKPSANQLREGFAEAFSDYSTNPEAFKKNYPSLAKYFETQLMQQSVSLPTIPKDFFNKEAIQSPSSIGTFIPSTAIKADVLRTTPIVTEGRIIRHSPIWAVLQYPEQKIQSVLQPTLNFISEKTIGIKSSPLTGMPIFIPSKYATPQEKQVTSIALDIGTFFIPYVGVTRMISFAGSEIGKRGEYSQAQGVKGVGGILSSQWQYTKEKPVESISTLLIGLAGTKKFFDVGRSIFTTKAIKEVPTQELISQVKPFSRQRATIMLKTEEGKYILGKTPSGDIISLGGGVEKGQTIKQAAIAELKQETGLTLKDIKDFQYKQKIVTPEETYYIYTGILKAGSKIKAASDISSVVKVSPNNLFIKGVTGQTSNFPISRPIITTSGIGRIRAYEAGIINTLETGKPMTWLYVPTKEGRVYLGTQSRYDIPYKIQKKYLQQDILGLAHGTTEPKIIRKWWPFEKKTIIEASKTERGQKAGLYLQPPISAKAPKLRYVGLSYLGYKVPTSEYGGIKIGWRTPSAYLFKEAPKSPIIPTPKTYAGTESELLIKPSTTISSIGKAETFSIGFKKAYFQPAKIIKESKPIADITFTSGYSPSLSFIGKVTKKTSSSEIYYNYKAPEEIIAKSLSALKSPTKNIESSKSYSKINISISSSNLPSISKSAISEVSTLKSDISTLSDLKSSNRNYQSEISSLKSLSSSISSISSTISIPSKPSVPSKPTSPSYPSYTPPNPSPSELKKIMTSKYQSSSKFKKGYQAFIKLKGKYKPIGRETTKGEATRIGEREARQTLRATFKVVPTGRIIYGIEETFIPSPKIFRTYMIRKGKKIPLEDTWIQKREKRLSSIGEKSEIQLARRIKLKSKRRLKIW